MAHVAKYKSGSVGNMCGHYNRWKDQPKPKERDNVDRSRTPLNYNLAPERSISQAEFVQQRIASLGLKRKPRKDAVVMCDCVLTMPKSLDPERERDFFRAGYEFLSGRYGSDNVISAYVHKDETMPHMHFAWVPVTPDGRLSAKDVVSRRDLATLHSDMQKYVENTMGEEVELLLDESKALDKALSKVGQDELDRARASIVADAEAERDAIRAEIEQETERLERLRCAREGREVEVERVEAEAGRLERIAGKVDALEHARLGGRREALDALLAELRSQVRALYEAVRTGTAARFCALGDAIGDAIESINDLVRAPAKRAETAPVAPPRAKKAPSATPKEDRILGEGASRTRGGTAERRGMSR